MHYDTRIYKLQKFSQKDHSKKTAKLTYSSSYTTVCQLVTLAFPTTLMTPVRKQAGKHSDILRYFRNELHYI